MPLIWDKRMSATETRRKHIPTWMLKRASALEREGQEIVSMFDGMTRLNAPKVREELQTKFPAWLKKVEVLSAQIQACNLDLQSWKQKAKEADQETRYYREKTSDLQEEFKRMSAQLSAMQDFKKYMTPERREAFMKLLHDATRLGYTR